jgi:multidrug efflux pump subunit AcrA (membrane-fusion protein)
LVAKIPSTPFQKKIIHLGQVSPAGSADKFGFHFNCQGAPMHMQKKIVSIATLFVISLLLLTGCGANAATETTTTIGTGNVTQITVVTTVEATGSITPLRMASVDWKTSGTIANILVQVGQSVLANDILMSLDPSTVPDSLISAQQNLVEMTSPASIAKAQLAVVTADENLTNELNSRYYLNNGYSQGVIDDAYAKMVLADVSLTKAKDNYDKVSNLSVGNEDRARAYTALYAAQTAYDSAKRLYVIYSGNPDNNDITMADANVSLAQAQLDEARNFLAALTGGDVPENATGASLQQLNQARRTVDQLDLRAPFDGLVGALYNQTSDVIAGNTTSAVIVNRSKLFVTVQVEESKMVQLAVGDKALVTLDALPDLEPQTGRVMAIDPVGIANQGVVYYSVKVELDQANPQIPLDATANVTIQAGDASQELAVPVTAVQNDATGEYVSVYNADGSTRRVEVVSGLIQADDTVVVQGDLKVGEQVLLVQTSGTTSSQGEGIRGGGIFMP